MTKELEAQLKLDEQLWLNYQKKIKYFTKIRQERMNLSQHLTLEDDSNQ